MTFLFDGHTHVFNAGFLPIEGVAISRGLDKDLASVLTDFIERVLERESASIDDRNVSEYARQRLELYGIIESEFIGDNQSREPTDFITRVVTAVPADDLKVLHPALQSVRSKLDVGRPIMSGAGAARWEGDRRALAQLL